MSFLVCSGRWEAIGLRVFTKWRCVATKQRKCLLKRKSAIFAVANKETLIAKWYSTIKLRSR